MQPEQDNFTENNINTPPPSPTPPSPVQPEPVYVQPQPQPESFQQPVQNFKPQPNVFQQPVQPQPMQDPMVSQVQPTQPAPSNKKILIIAGIILGIIMLGVVLTAAVLISNSSKQNKATDNSDIVNDKAPIEKEASVPSGYKRVGEADFGYINVPEDWIIFNEIGAQSGTMMQYSDTAGFSVVTVTKYPKNYNLDEFTSMIGGSLSGPPVTQDTLIIDGNTANLLSQDYTSTEGKLFDTYIFEETDKLSTISVEYASTNKSVAKEIIDSYRLIK